MRVGGLLLLFLISSFRLSCYYGSHKTKKEKKNKKFLWYCYEELFMLKCAKLTLQLKVVTLLDPIDTVNIGGDENMSSYS